MNNCNNGLLVIMVMYSYLGYTFLCLFQNDEDSDDEGELFN